MNNKENYQENFSVVGALQTEMFVIRLDEHNTTLYGFIGFPGQDYADQFEDATGRSLVEEIYSGEKLFFVGTHDQSAAPTQIYILDYKHIKTMRKGTDKELKKSQKMLSSAYDLMWSDLVVNVCPMSETNP